MKNLITTCLAVTTLLMMGVTSDGNANTNSSLDHDINNSLQLKHSWHTALSINQTPGQPIRLAIPIEDRTYTLELAPYSTRADEYAVFMQDNKGELYEVPAGPVRTLRGSIAELDGSVVAGSLMSDGLYARIRLVDGKEYWMEPLGDKINGTPHNLYVFYRTEDVIPSDGVCGTGELINAGKSFGLQARRETNRGSFRGTDMCTAQLAFDTDYEYYQEWGSGTEARINQVIDSINLQYESEVNLTHEITTIIVRSNSNDPYSSNNHETLLYQFQAEWTSNQSSIPRDVAHLFTGRELDGSVIGVAWVGVICNFTYQYGLSQSDFDGNYSCATDLTAHELGHNWNAGHCDCPSYTMNPYITCANQFTQGSINTITSFANSLSCLSCGVPDPTGGCCVGENCSIVTASDCSAWGGTYLGDNTNCNGDPCYVPPTGACCVGETCSIMTSSDCEASDGSFLGDGSNCEGNPCNDGVWNVPGDFPTIQEAIDASSDGDEIVVMPGTYTGTGEEVVNLLGKAVWLHSSDGQDATIIDGETTRRVLLCISGEDINTIIEGFTITNGYASSTGGGMYNSYSNPTLTDCTFTNNTAGNSGGGMYNYSSDPTLDDCTFTNNSAGNNGGGMRNVYSSPTLENCTFTGNSAKYGGGMNNYDSNPILTDCTFEGNSAIDLGGGMRNAAYSSPALTNCTFTGNSADYGGGMYNYLNSSPALTNCTFTGNSADYGGGMYNFATISPTLTDTTICGNSPDQIYGDWTDNGGNTIAEACPVDCPDINGDGYVNVSDLLSVIDQWGLTNSPADVNFDGIVDVSDLLIVVGNWGPCQLEGAVQWTIKEGGNDHWYLVDWLPTEPTSWSDINQHAISLEGHLVTILSQEENNFVINLMESLKENNGWIGFTSEANTNTWQWVTGEPVDFTSWGGSNCGGQAFPNDTPTLFRFVLLNNRYFDCGWNWDDFRQGHPLNFPVIIEWSN